MNPFDEYFPPGFTLETSKIILRPLQKEDAEAFLPITAAPSLWKYFTRKLHEEHELIEWIEQALADRKLKSRVPFTIVQKATNQICGSSSYGNISFFDRRIEIGWSWLGERFLGTGINQHAKYALLTFAFEQLLFERVEIKTDNLNERAKQALRKIGAKEEGVLRSHMLMPEGRRRDSVYFSILKAEWPHVKQSFFQGIT